ncbi:hypothetical protein AWB81_07623 [Caballeronia arationis]|nr:hypothetical protein AWB81_07623 [Caballeronia arationis]
MLFRTSAQTLRSIAADPKHLGAGIRVISVVHTRVRLRFRLIQSHGTTIILTAPFVAPVVVPSYSPAPYSGGQASG